MKICLPFILIGLTGVSYGQPLDALIDAYNNQSYKEVEFFANSCSFDFNDFHTNQKCKNGEYKVGYNSQNEIINVEFKINDVNVILNRSGINPRLYTIKQIEDLDTVFNQGFILSSRKSLYYISFQNEPVINQSKQYSFPSKGSLKSIHSISILSSSLENRLSFFYEEGDLLFASKFIYEKGECKRVVASSTNYCDLSIHRLNHSIDLLFEVMVKNSLKPISILIPQVNEDYYSYLWLFEDKYLNELFTRKE